MAEEVRIRPWTPGEPVHAEGFGVVLRSMSAADLDESFVAQLRNPLVSRNLAMLRDPAAVTRASLLRTLEGFDNRRNFFLHVGSADGVERLGFCFARTQGPGVLSITAAITDPQHWRRHAAAAAARVLRCFLFDAVKAHKLVSRVYGDNAAVLRWCREYGWVQEGVLREEEPDGRGGRRDIVVFGLLRAEHLAGKVAEPYRR